MKKIFKVTNWDTAKISDIENNWLITSLTECLILLGVTPTFQAKSPNPTGTGSTAFPVFDLSIPGYEGTVSIGMSDYQYGGIYSNDNSFIWYVNTEKKEIVGCVNGGLSGQYRRSGQVLSKSSWERRYGPLIAIKLKDNKLIGFCIGYSTSETSSSSDTKNAGYNPLQIGCLVADCNETITPTAGIKYKTKRGKKPILGGLSSTKTYLSFNGDYFEDVYLTDKYFNVPMKTADNKCYAYDGKLFIVDDATDIGTIETTV